LWSTLVGLLLTKTIGIHYEIIVKYSKPQLTSSPNYSWFVQYMKSDNRESGIIQLPLGTNSSSTSSNLIYYVLVVLDLPLSLLIQLLNFSCSGFGLLFVECTTMFTTLKGREQCSPIGFLFQEDANVVVYLIVPKSQLF
jgi:hypothetical protein